MHESPASPEPAAPPSAAEQAFLDGDWRRSAALARAALKASGGQDEGARQTLSRYPTDRAVLGLYAVMVISFALTVVLTWFR